MASDSTRAQRLIMAATVVGFALRLAFGFGYWQHRPLTHDEREYLALARSLAQGKGFVYDAPASETGTSQQFGRAPGYPAFLALIGAGREEFDATPARVKLAQSIVGAVGVWLIGLIGYRAAGARAGIAAAAMAAVYPPLVWICSYVLSEALYSTMALASVVLLNLAIDRAEIRRRTAAPLAITAGLAVGFAILVRPVMLLFLPIAALWLIARRRTPIALAVIVAAALVVAPWTLRNARVYHRFVLVASEGGVTFWTGNHPRARGEGDLAANPHIKVADLAFRAEHPEMSAEELEPLYYRDALRYIGGHPLLHHRSGGSVVCVTLPFVPGRVDRLVLARAASWRARRNTLAKPTASAGSARAACPFSGSRLHLVFSSGAFSYSRARSSVDRVRRRVVRIAHA